ncbi:MAG: ClpXP protease specificity-enhancing factor SspB [Pseudomonadota bacterium]
MTDDTPDSLIPYDEIVQEALRAVVGRVLGSIEQSGGELPGNHHFYITFKTGAPGVSIPPHLKERFPDEMTIVLQNKFWELEVREEGFCVGLSFNQIPAKLDVPFAAITAFVDPAVDFGLQFQATVTGIEPESHEDAENDGVTKAPADSDRDNDSDSEGGDGSDSGSNVVTVDFGRKK